jgi:hypothetical protein
VIDVDGGNRIRRAVSAIFLNFLVCWLERLSVDNPEYH